MEVTRASRIGRRLGPLVWVLALLAGPEVFAVEGGHPVYVLQVTAERVNLRARPTLEAETVGQVQKDQLVYAKSLGLQWVEISAPEGMAVWVHRDYVAEGKVTASTLNLRAGPGINYSVVGEVPRGAPVDPLETFGEWFRILAPASCSFWISREFVREVGPLGDTPATIVEFPPIPDGPAIPARPIAAIDPGEPLDPAVELPQPVRESDVPGRVEAQPVRSPGVSAGYAAPADLKLIPLDGQGRETRVEGRLRRSGFSFKKPSRYRLVSDDSRTVCYIRGNTEQLKEMLDRQMLIVGREYWVQKSKYPVVVPERIILPKK